MRKRRELSEYYLPVLYEILRELQDAKNAEPVVATSNDETLQRVFRRAGYLAALEDIQKQFEDLRV